MASIGAGMMEHKMEIINALWASNIKAEMLY